MGTDTFFLEGAMKSLNFAVFFRTVGGIQPVFYAQLFKEITDTVWGKFPPLICPDFLYREGCNIHNPAEEINGVFCVRSSLVEIGKGQNGRHHS